VAPGLAFDALTPRIGGEYGKETKC
jgi:hypothetical protein